MINKQDPFALLQHFINAPGAPGEEAAVRDVAKPIFDDICDEVSVDVAGNLIGLVKGRDRKAPAVRLVAHMDELAMMVKRVRDDGTLRVDRLGSFNVYSFGQGPVEIHGDNETLRGVLSLGSQHASQESYSRFREPDWLKAWEYAFVFTGKDKPALDAAGVHPGSRVVIANQRRKLWRMDDHVCGYFLDDRAAIVMLIEAIRLLQKSKSKPAVDTYLVLSTCEEIGSHGASHAMKTLPGETVIAVDIGPAAPEYGVTLSADPVVVYGDATGVYDKPLSDAIRAAGKQAKVTTQTAVWSRYGSDASATTRNGSAAVGALICFPGENTHGYEVMHVDAIDRTAKLIAAYLKSAG